MNLKLLELRKRHSKLLYKSFKLEKKVSYLHVTFDFELTEGPSFSPELEIPYSNEDNSDLIERMVFLVGMIELISYWKAACPRTIEVQADYLSDFELSWFKNLYQKGLGEFFYLNDISPDLDFEIVCSSAEAKLAGAKFASKLSKAVNEDQRSLVMVGGGKDSLVSLKLLKEIGTVSKGFLMNPIPASLIGLAAVGDTSPLVVKRSICPKLIELNKLGYLNGHTPFSALLAFVALLTAELNNFSTIISSNESTANEANISYLGFEINHQYSKSIEFENDFRNYLKWAGISKNYFSLLRPLNEIQISGLLSKEQDLLPVFLSCNRAQTFIAKAQGQIVWCGECPKCIFTFLCLCCFLPLDRIREIWGRDLFTTESFYSTCRDLVGLGDHKPFECVGSFSESVEAYRFFYEKLVSFSKSDLIPPQISNEASSLFNLLPENSSNALDYWDEYNFLDQNFSEFLKAKIHGLKYQ